MKFFHTILLLYLVSLSKGANIYIMGSVGVQFSIYQLGGGASTSVDGIPVTRDFDIHPCNGSIIWGDYGHNAISRWTPTSSGNTPVINTDLYQPISVAVDWRGNNIYFSHRFGENGPSRIEVVSADGRFRRVIVAPLANSVAEDDSIYHLALSVATGHLYYTYLNQIISVGMDGQNSSPIYTSQCPTTTISITLDPLTNTLFWVDCGGSLIRWMDVTNPSLTGNFSTAPSVPYRITALNDTFYWTVQSGGGGAVYKVDQPRSGLSQAPANIWTSSTIIPYAVRVSVDGFSCSQGGCALRNGGCGSLCLTTPTGPTCACSSGLMINSDNTSCPTHPRAFVLFSKNFPSRSEIRILSFDLGENPPFPNIDYLVPIAIKNANANYIAYDVVGNRVYWIEEDIQSPPTIPPTIKRAFLDGTGMEVFINTSISAPRVLAIDPYSRNLYWVDSHFRTVMVASLSNPAVRTTILTVEDQPPFGFDLDISRGYMFWSVVAGSSPRVQRARMDGSNQAYLSGPGYVVQPGQLASDPTTGLVYWFDQYQSLPVPENEIEYVNGSVGRSTMPTMLGFSRLNAEYGPSNVVDMVVFGQWVYWSDASTGNLQRAYKLSTLPTLPTMSSIVTPNGYGNVCGLTAVNMSLPIVQTGCNSNNGNCAQLCLPTGVVASPTCACASHLSSVNGQCVVASNQVLLATATSLIVQQISSTPTMEVWTTTFTFNIQNVTGLAVNASGQRAYWINTAQKSIYSAYINVTMATPEPIVTCLSKPTDLAVDWAGLNIYWTDAQRRVIEVAKAADGSGRSVVAKLPIGPNQLALDPRRGFLYWMSLEDRTPTIYKLLMSGSGTSTVFWTGNPADGVPGSLLVAYRNTSLTPDALYWVMRNSSSNRSIVYQASLEGNSPTPATILSLNGLPASIAVLGDFLYYTISSNLAVTRKSIPDPSITNTNAFYIATAGNAITDIQFLSYILQPDVHKCSIPNDFCIGTGALCLSTGISSGTCLCPPHTAKYYNTMASGNVLERYLCKDTNTFLLISTADTIYYLPYGANAVQPLQLLPLSIGPLYNVEAIAYDHNHERILWADSTSGTVGVSGLYGSPCSTVTTLSGLAPYSLAYDWKGSNIFLTESNRFEVEIVTSSGVKTLLGDLMAYRDLVMNSDQQILYIRLQNSTIYNVSLATPTTLNRMYPTTGSASLSNLVYQASTNALLWVNLNASTIEMFFIANQTVRVIGNYVGSIAGLAAVGTDVLWLNTADWWIYRYNQVTISQFYLWPRLKVSDFLGVVESATTYTTLPCDSMPCSDICLYDNNAPATPKCTCPAYKTLTSSTVCSALQCKSVDQFVCKDQSACIPTTYFCDGINHCRDSSDELNPYCPCSKIPGASDFKLCSNASQQCVLRSLFCNGVNNCNDKMDESPLQCGCPVPSDFKCYQKGVLVCLNQMYRCDGIPDCDDKSDELNCSTTASTTPPSITNSPSSTFLPSSTYIVISIALVIVIILVGAAVTWCITSFVLHRRKYAQPQKVEQLSVNGRSCMSPQQRSDSTSQYSGTSMGTHSTLLGGAHVDGAGVKRCVSMDLGNPPPSPITMHHYDLPIGPESGENISTISQPMPLVPNPSMNFSVADGISDGMSISVSQRNFPINGTAHHDTRVLYRRVPGSVYSSHTNGTTVYVAPPLYQNNKYREVVQFRHDPEVRSISTISSSTLGTENPEQYNMYEDMDHDAPPPSPVTEVSNPQYSFPANSPMSTSGYLESQF